MLEDFLSYIEADLSVIREDKLLLSVSGGIDSMVMLHLFRQLPHKIEVAHINHSTRNGKSDEDMAFVEAYCRDHSIPFHAKTLDYNQLQSGNFQENARNERFKFLTEIQKTRNCNWVATAHHKTDRWETFLMHLNRKSGIRGLTSLRGKENRIIHPLLIFTKSQIIHYAHEHKIDFVHDSSNDTVDYLRNAIRHRVTPVLEKLFPEFILNVNQSITHLDRTSSLLKELVNQQGFISYDNLKGYFILALDKIKTFKNQYELLYFVLEEYEFNHSTVNDILSTSNTGAQFNSDSYEGLFDRGKLIIREKKEIETINFKIMSPGIYELSNGNKLNVQLTPSIPSESHLWLDSQKIRWPLIIRNIESGDKFKPEGMNGATKSLKKFCTDLKINRFVKEDLLLVCQAEEILQIVGYRTRYEYTTNDIKNALTFNIVV